MAHSNERWHIKADLHDTHTEHHFNQTSKTSQLSWHIEIKISEQHSVTSSHVNEQLVECKKTLNSNALAEKNNATLWEVM